MNEAPGVVFAARSPTDPRRVRWWRANREKAPDLLERELEEWVARAAWAHPRRVVARRARCAATLNGAQARRLVRAELRDPKPPRAWLAHDTE